MIHKVEVEGEALYLKKSAIFGWNVVEPAIREDGTINWKNLLGLNKRNLIMLGFIILIAVMFYVGINELVSNYKLVAENPCAYCLDCSQKVTNTLKDLNFSIVGG